MCAEATGQQNAAMRNPRWTTRLELALADPNALRVLDKLSIVRSANSVRPGISEPTGIDIGSRPGRRPTDSGHDIPSRNS